MNYNLRFAYEFLKSQGLKSLDVQSIKDILFKQGFTISYIEDTEEYSGQAKSLPVFHVADTITTDTQNKIIYIGKGLEENHCLYLLCAELYKILYSHRHQNALDITKASHTFAGNLQRLTGANKLWWRFISKPLLPIITAVVSANTAAVALLFLGAGIGANFSDISQPHTGIGYTNTISFDEASTGYPVDKLNDISEIPSKQVSAFDGGTASSLDFVSGLPQSQSQDDFISDNQALTKIQNPKANNSNESDTPVSAESTFASDAQNDTTYYVTKSGKKYHTQYCSYVTGKDNIKQVTKDIISVRGYTPCSRCTP